MSHYEGRRKAKGVSPQRMSDLTEGGHPESRDEDVAEQFESLGGWNASPGKMMDAGPPELGIMVDMVHRMMEEFNDKLTHLEERLDPVLRNPRSDEEGDALNKRSTPEDDERSPVFNHVARLEPKLFSFSARLTQLTDRVEYF